RKAIHNKKATRYRGLWGKHQSRCWDKTKPLNEIVESFVANADRRSRRMCCPWIRAYRTIVVCESPRREESHRVCFYNNIHIDNTWSRGIGWTQNFGWNAGVTGVRIFIRHA